jgi:hypothetical protein
MARGRASLFRVLSLACVLASACTFVNSFDDVKPSAEGTYEAGVAAPFDIAAPEGGPVGDGSATSSLGAIVLAGQVVASGVASSVLTVVDPVTGREIAAREPMVVAGIRYDGLRDLWWIFESRSADFAPGPTDEVVLHARSLDVATGTWTERGSLPVLPIQSYDSIAVLRDRLLYVAHGASAGNVQLVTIDTADPTKLAKLDAQPLDRAPRGMIGTRDTTGPGGVADLVRTGKDAAGCPDGGTCLEVIRVRVSNTGPPLIDPPHVIGEVQGNGVPSYASLASLDREVVVFPRASADAAAPTRAVMFEPRNQEIDGIEARFFMTDNLLRRSAVSECQRQLFLVGGNNDLAVHVVPLLGDGGGTPTKASSGHSGQSVYFEPTTKTVLAPFAQGPGFDLTAFYVRGPSNAPTLAKRTRADWNPPNDIRPTLLGIREPLPIVCF